MAKNSLSTIAGETFNELKLSAEKNAPTILIVSGVAGMVAAGVLACFATKKLSSKMDIHQEKIEEIKEKKEDELITEKEYKKEITKEYAKMAWSVTKLYGPSVILAGLSAGIIFESNDIMRKRNASLAAAYTTIDSAFKAYRKRVVDKYGEEEDIRMMTGAKEETIEEEVVDPETGKKKKVKKKVNVIDPNDVENWNSYARIMGKFPQESIHYCTGFCPADPDMSFNETQISMANNYLTDRLVTNGYLTLNEVYEELGFKRTKAGQQVGWIYNSKKGDNYIDFRLNTNFWYKDCDGKLARGILIDPNVQGYILDEIPADEI